MTRVLAWAFTPIVIGLLVTAGIVAPLQPLSGGDTVMPAPGVEATSEAEGNTLDGTQMDNGSDEPVPAGGLVSSVIGMEDSRVDSTVAIEQFATRLSAASTDAERARVVASSLNRSRQQVATLEQRLDTLERRRANGSITQGWFEVEVAWLLAAAENQRRVTARIERTARTVSADELARRAATVAEIKTVQGQIDRLLRKEKPEIHQTTFDHSFYDDLGGFVDRFNQGTDSTTTTERALFDGNTVNLYIESDAGQPAILSFVATERRRIEDVRAGRAPDATVRLEMDEQTARELLAAENAQRAFETSLNDGGITVTDSKA